VGGGEIEEKEDIEQDPEEEQEEMMGNERRM
jgi:hypothetical protein